MARGGVAGKALAVGAAQRAGGAEGDHAGKAQPASQTVLVKKRGRAVNTQMFEWLVGNHLVLSRSWLELKVAYCWATKRFTAHTASSRPENRRTGWRLGLCRSPVGCLPVGGNSHDKRLKLNPGL